MLLLMDTLITGDRLHSQSGGQVQLLAAADAFRERHLQSYTVL